MTDEQINKLCAEALGETYHAPISGRPPECKKIGCTDFRHIQCECGIVAATYDHFESPDFCTDRNAVARLVEKCDEGKIDKAFDDVTGWMDDPDNVIVAPFILKRPPRTIALACLVALGKITLEEAKDAK